MGDGVSVCCCFSPVRTSCAWLRLRVKAYARPIIVCRLFLFLSGANFSLTLLWCQVSSIVCAIVYQHFYFPPSGISKIGATFLYIVVGLLAVTWVVFFAIFLRQIKPKYVSTFFTTSTGFQFTIDSFKHGDDAQRSFIFSVQKRHWASIREEVKDWTTSNWSKWELEKPVWFTDLFISTVPDDFIPKRLAPDRRRSSLLESLLSPSAADSLGAESKRRSTKLSRRRAASAKVAPKDEP